MPFVMDYCAGHFIQIDFHETGFWGPAWKNALHDLYFMIGSNLIEVLKIFAVFEKVYCNSLSGRLKIRESFVKTGVSLGSWTAIKSWLTFPSVDGQIQ